MNRFSKSKPPSFLKVFERTDEKDNRRLLDASMASFTDSVLPSSSSSSGGVLGEKQVIPEEEEEEDAVVVAFVHHGRKDEESGRVIGDENDATVEASSSKASPESQKQPNSSKLSQDREGDVGLSGPPSPSRSESSSNQNPSQASPAGFYRSASERRLPQMGGLARAPNSERSLGSSTSSMHYSPTKSPYPGSPQRLTAVPESLVKHAEGVLFSPEKSSRKLGIFGRLRAKKDGEDTANKPELEVAVAEVDGGEGAMPFAQLTLEAVAPKSGNEALVVETGAAGRGGERSSQRTEMDETDSEHSFATEKLSNREGKAHHNRRSQSRSESANGAMHASHRRTDEEGKKAGRNKDRHEHRAKLGESTSKATSRQSVEHVRRSKPEVETNDRSGRNGEGHHNRRRKSEDAQIALSRNGDGHIGSKAHSNESPERRRKTSDGADKEDMDGKFDALRSNAEPTVKRKSTRSISQEDKASSSPARSERKLQHVAETLEWRRVTRSPTKLLSTRRDSHAPRRAQTNSKAPSKSDAKVANKAERNDRKGIVRSASSDADSSRHSATNDERKGSEEGKNCLLSAASGKTNPEFDQEGGNKESAPNNVKQKPRHERSTSVNQGSSSHNAKSLGNFLDQARSHSDHNSPSWSPGNGRSTRDETSVTSDGTAKGIGVNDQESGSSQTSDKRRSTGGGIGASIAGRDTTAINQRDTSRPRRKGLFQFPVDSEHTLDADVFQGGCGDADRSSPKNMVGTSGVSEADGFKVDAERLQDVDTRTKRQGDSLQSYRSTNESHLLPNSSNDKSSSHSSGSEELYSPRGKGGVFESAILQHCGGEVGVLVGDPQSPKLPSTVEGHFSTSHGQQGHTKQLTRRSRRRSSTTTLLPMSSSDLPMTPLRRLPRRASSNAAPASTGRINRRVATLARTEKTIISSQLAVALARNDVKDSATAFHVSDRAIQEYDEESEASIDLPVPAPMRFDEIPFLSISDLVTENVDDALVGTLRDLSHQISGVTDLSRNGSMDIEHLAAGESTIETSHSANATLSRDVAVNNSEYFEDQRNYEYSRLSLELAQSRIRLREARLEVNRLEQDILRLKERLLVLEQPRLNDKLTETCF